MNQEIVKQTEWGVVKYIPGKSLGECFFYAADNAKNEYAVTAADLVPPSIVTMAQQETKDKQLAVQPAEYVEFFAKSCNSVEDFKNQVLAMAVKNQGIGVTAANEDEPIWATEPHNPIKPQTEPVVAAEAGLTAQSKEGGRAKSPVKQFYGKLPGDVTDRPEYGVDFQSSASPEVIALQQQLRTQAEELATTKQELTDTKKDHELDELKTSLTDVGVIKKPQDWDKYSKMLKGLDEKAIGVVETLIRDIAKAYGEGDMGTPKPSAKKPAGPGTGLETDLPPIKSSENIMLPPAPPEDSYGNTNQQLANLWLQRGMKQNVSRVNV